MEKLPAEIFSELLDQLEPRGREVPITSSRRNPWACPQPYRPEHIDSRQHYANLRLVCKRFNDLATPYLFRSIGLRFNARSFGRLECLAANPALARHVRKFVYLMPYVYEEGIQSFEDFRNDMTLGLSNKERQIMFEEQAPYYYTTVYKEQQNLMRNSYDLNVLRKAMLAFTSLQEVHLLAIMMHKDIMLRNLASSFDNWEFIDCKWIPACKHAAETLLAALYDAKSPVTALCSPTMSPQSLILLGPKARQMSLYTWSQLTYLEITFDERPDRSWDTLDTILTGHDNTLAEMFRHCLHATKNLTTLYIRFTPGIPVRLPLKDAFHDFHWPKLRVLGIGSWMLHAEEIIDIVRRHQTTLHGIRLNEIYLLEGSRWKDVVQAVREHVSNIDWVGLHDIGYEGEYVRKQAYIETYSDTSSESEYEYDFDSLSMRSRDSNSSTTASHDAMQSLEGDGARGEGEDVVYGNVFMTASGTGQPGTSQAGGSSSLNSNIFGGNFGNGGGFGMVEEEEDLEDDGQRVTQAKQKHWERWIMGRAHTGEPYNRPL